MTSEVSVRRIRPGEHAAADVLHGARGDERRAREPGPVDPLVEDGFLLYRNGAQKSLGARPFRYPWKETLRVVKSASTGTGPAASTSRRTPRSATDIRMVTLAPRGESFR